MGRLIPFLRVAAVASGNGLLCLGLVLRAIHAARSPRIPGRQAGKRGARCDDPLGCSLHSGVDLVSLFTFAGKRDQHSRVGGCRADRLPVAREPLHPHKTGYRFFTSLPTLIFPGGDEKMK